VTVLCRWPNSSKLIVPMSAIQSSSDPLADTADLRQHGEHDQPGCG
jgi:hypothetical protein